MFQRIYNNPILLYSICFSGGLFWLFLTFQDFTDFITREFIESLSLFIAIMSFTLFIQEIYKKLFKQGEKETEVESTQSSQENNNKNYPKFQSFDTNEKPIYEWEEEDEEEIKEQIKTVNKETVELSKKEFQELKQEIENLKQKLKEKENQTEKEERKKEEIVVENPWANEKNYSSEEEENISAEAFGFEPTNDKSPVD